MTDKYNDLIKKYATANNLPWLLVYYQIEQESGGIANLTQFKSGALGLMQLMPSTFPSYSKDQLLNPETNINLGCGYLRQCIDVFKLEHGDEAISFGLAAYNAGVGNIIQAQEKAKTASYPTDRWSCVGPSLVLVTGLSNALQTNWYVHIIMSNYLNASS